MPRSTTTPPVAFLTAHPDDHEMMLSYYTLATAHIGAEVFAYVATDGEASTLGDPAFVASHRRRQEALKGLGSLGLSKPAIHFAALTDGALASPRQTALLASDIAAFLHRHSIAAAVTLGPDGGDHHPDHIAVHAATLAAIAELAATGANVTIWGLNASGRGARVIPAGNKLDRKLDPLA